MIPVLKLGLTLLGLILNDLVESNAPAEVIAVVTAAMAGLAKHKDDLLTKANFEKQRG